MYVLDEPRVDYTLQRGPLRRGAQLEAIGPIGLRPALLVVSLLEVSEKEVGVVALHLPIGPLKPRSGLESVPRYEPSTNQPISQRLSHCAIMFAPVFIFYRCPVVVTLHFITTLQTHLGAEYNQLLKDIILKNNCELLLSQFFLIYDILTCS